ncbi:MAG: hypothetical protein H6732_13445 [Alphaproteobacteria bacterium]|nr:hypothetical protein [Alphaproteobacteria bacterium]
MVLALLVFGAATVAAADSPGPREDPAPTEGPVVESRSESARASRFALTAAYYGETVTHTGLAVGFEYYAWEGPVYKLIVASKTGFYLHPRSHGAYFLDAELGHRGTARFGLFGEVFTTVGYYHTWPYGDVYEEASGGGVERKPNAGNPHVKFGGALGFGWDLSKNHVAPASLFARLELFAEHPFNTEIAMHAALIVGVIWRFGQEPGAGR